MKVKLAKGLFNKEIQLPELECPKINCKGILDFQLVDEGYGCDCLYELHGTCNLCKEYWNVNL